MHADRGHGAAGRFVRLRAPGVLGQSQPVQCGLLRTDGHDRTKALFPDRAAQQTHRRMKTPVEPDSQNDPGLGRRIQRGRGVRDAQGEGLFHEHVLPGGGGTGDLLHMQTMRCGQHDGVDLWIAQDGFVIGDPAQPPFPAEGGGRVLVARMGRGKADGLAGPDAVDEVLAPPAQTEDRGADHMAIIPCLSASRCPNRRALKTVRLIRVPPLKHSSLHHNSRLHDPGPSGGSLAEMPAVSAMSDHRAQAAAIRGHADSAPPRHA